MISLHVIVDNATNNQLDLAMWYLATVQPPVVNVAAGAQIDRGMKFVERIRLTLPNIVIIWRVLEDTGIHTRMSPPNWFNAIVRPRLSWMKFYHIVMLLDNESSGNDDQIRAYVRWEIEALALLHREGLYGAVARFATGNIDDGGNGSDQYPFLKPLFDALLPGDWVSPNEYTNMPGKSSAGSIGRYKLMEAVAGRKLPITIGEAGLLDDYQARDGWMGRTTEREYVKAILADEQGYRPDITRCLFCIGGYQEWDTLQVTEGILQLLITHYKENAPVTARHVIITIVYEGTRVRAEPNVKGAIVASLPKGEFAAIVTGNTVAANGYTWLPIDLGDKAGWIASEVIEVRDAPPVEQPPLPPDADVCLDRDIIGDAKDLLLAESYNLEVLRQQVNAQISDFQSKIAAIIQGLNTAH